ncbi:MAG: RluA family pseudouridine synthase [Bacillota bacterium]
MAGGIIAGEQGLIDEPIARKPGSIVEREVSPGGKDALTGFRVLKFLPKINATVVEVVAETGRTHQIRVHMSHVGHPLLGDSLYGGDCTHINRQALHLHSLSFAHPGTGKKVVLKSSLPDDMAGLVGDM